jgi:malate dehydrogenase (quinone)
MVQVIERCFTQHLREGWADKLKQMIPSYGQSLIENTALCRQVRADTAATLNLQNIPS